MKTPFEVLPLDTYETPLIGIPEALRLLVVQNKSAFVGPARGGECQCLAVYLTAVHSRQIDEGSVTHSYSP